MHSPYDVSDMRPALSKKSLINVNEDGQGEFHKTSYIPGIYE